MNLPKQIGPTTKKMKDISLKDFISKSQSPKGVLSMTEYVIRFKSIEEQALDLMDNMPPDVHNAFIMSAGPSKIDDDGKWRKEIRTWFMQTGGYNYFLDNGVKMEVIADKETIESTLDLINKGKIPNPFKN